MLGDLYSLGQYFLRTKNKPYKRYIFKTKIFKPRGLIIVGQRGVGKTTAIVQYLLDTYKDIFTSKGLYIQADHFLVANRSLYEIAEEFYNLDGELICIDEIHRYQDWAKELKSIFDTFPKLKIIASGSSALELKKGGVDLSRRFIFQKIPGLSFREFIELTLGENLDSYDLEDIIANHQKIAEKVINKIEYKKKKILLLFNNYLKHGYYPYFDDLSDAEEFYITLEQGIHTTIESDLTSIHPKINGSSVNKIKKLLAIIAASVPFKPDLKHLKTLLDIGDERTLKLYIKYLDEAGVINVVNSSSKGLRVLEKPEKIYLNNTNQIYALSDRKTKKDNLGNIRETFFTNSLLCKHNLVIPGGGDFIIDSKYTIEVGGKNKNNSQIKNIKNSYLAVDDIEIGINGKIPLWLFGFLY